MGILWRLRVHPERVLHMMCVSSADRDGLSPQLRNLMAVHEVLLLQVSVDVLMASVVLVLIFTRP
eukprot:5884879-Amphidinium_carterae.2